MMMLGPVFDVAAGSFVYRLMRLLEGATSLASLQVMLLWHHVDYRTLPVYEVQGCFCPHHG